MRPYLEEAVYSVLKQSVDSKEYEVIIITCFEHPFFDSIRRANVRIVTVDGTNGPVNLISVGIKESKGEILCFLDDDDIFDFNKLKIIREIFKSYPTVGFIHNAFKLINKNDVEKKNHKGQIKYKHPKLDFVVRNGDVYTKFRKIVDNNGLINASSMSVRKEAVESIGGRVLDLPGNYDGFIFYVCATSNFDMYFSSEYLTSYRIHNKNNSKPETYQGLLYYLSRLAKSAAMLDLYLSTNKHTIGHPELIYYSAKRKVAIGEEKPTISELTDLFRTFVIYGIFAYFTMLIIYLIYLVAGVSYYKASYKM